MAERGRGTGRVLATVFFTDMVGSTALAARLGDERWRELLATYHLTVRRAIRRGGGREVDSAGDGLFAVFDSPAAAIRCASRLTDELHLLGIEVRTGLHTGEVELMRGKVGGIAVHLGARVSTEAGPGEILVTGTVRDLVAGSNITCVDRGMRALKGIPSEWRLYAVERPDAVPLDTDAALEERWRRPVARRRRTRTAVVLAAAGAVAVAAVATVAVLHHGGAGAPATVVPAANTVAHLDAAAGGFTAAVRTGSGPLDVAVGGGRVWVVNRDDLTVAWIDPATGALSGTHDSGGTPTGMAYGAGSLWITSEFGQNGNQPGSLARFDPAQDALRTVSAVGGRGATAIAVADSPAAVWVTNDLDDTLLRLDPVTSDPVATISLHHTPRAIAVGGGSVWVGCADGTLLHVDPAANAVTATITLDAVPSAIAVGDGGVWVASETGNTVTLLDAATGNRRRTIRVDGGPAGIAAADGAVYVSAFNAGTVVRIDPGSGEVLARISVQGHPRGVAADGSGAWVTVLAR